MKNFNDLAEQFIEIFERLLAREKIVNYEYKLSGLFEAFAERLIESPLTFDGTINLSSRIKKSRQIVFEGDMWVGEDLRKQWKEPFQATVTDKRITKQGIWIKIRVGDYIGEGDLLKIFRL